MNSERLCGGSLIAPTWVLTAGHCVSLYKPSQVFVRAGVFNRSSSADEELEQQVLPVERIVVHNQYPQSSAKYDVALIQLARPARMTDSVRLVCVAEKAREEPPEDTMCVVSGWGHLEYLGGVSPELLRHVDVPLVSRRLVLC